MRGLEFYKILETRTFPALGHQNSFDFLPLKIKRLRDNEVENSVSVCENEKIRTTQGRGSTQSGVNILQKNRNCSATRKNCSEGNMHKET